MRRSLVAVVGSGAAGLAAARSLAAADFDVVVLEARDRAGGRAWTRTDPGWRTPAELGAEFIHGKGRTIRELLAEAGIADVETGGSDWAYCNGAMTRADDRFEAATRIVARFDPNREPDVSVDAFLDRFAAQPDRQDDVAAVRMLVEGFDAADPALAGIAGIAREWRGGASVQSGASRPIGGYAKLVEHMVAQLDRTRVHLQYQCVVEAIRRESERVVLTVRRHGERRTIEARAAIVTLPLGVLHARPADEGYVRFEPALPAGTQSAIDAIAMGRVVKVVMQFNQPFWTTLDGGRYGDLAFVHAAGAPFPALWSRFPAHDPSLTAWVGGPAADAVQPAPIETAIAQVGRTFGIDAETQLEAATVHDWASDPFARGAYSYLRINGGDARERLAEPIDGTLFFAGEGTASAALAGTVSGAVQSGIDAAAKVTAIVQRGQTPRP